MSKKRGKRGGFGGLMKPVNMGIKVGGGGKKRGKKRGGFHI